MQQTSQLTAASDLTFTRWLAGALRRRSLILGTAVAAVVLSLASTLILPPVYRSQASFVANSSSTSKLQSAGGAAAGLGGIISQLGGTVGGDPSESPNFYVGLLLSRELLTRLLNSKFPNPRTEQARDSATLLSILKVKGKDRQTQLETGVKNMTKAIGPGMDPRTNLVWFSVDAQWPELSAQIANKLIELVSSFNRETRVSRAKSKRVVLQRRHDSARAALREVEERQRFFYEQNRGMISAPSLRAEEQRMRRDGELAADLYVNLDRQLEIARLDEINDAALITVIDSAVVPRKAQWPRYGAALFSAGMFGLALGLLFAGSAAVMEDWIKRNPGGWADLKSTFKRRRSEVPEAVGLRPQREAAASRPPPIEEAIASSERVKTSR
ncbi:MAG TPA: hypothetical protein VM939_06340 [Gemmatimonadaceae bacterium]|nr:hypothetical protein [Gemmatimonadaceae bacterium]